MAPGYVRGNHASAAAGKGLPAGARQEEWSMADELSVTDRRERGAVIAEVTGDIDLSTVAGLRERLFGLADEGQPLIIDLNGVTFIDSTGLGVLVGTARRVAGHGGSLHAVCSQPQTRKLLWMTGVDRRIPLSDSVDGALTLMGAPGDAPG
jgi:anti-sigma B factor antagonist